MRSTIIILLIFVMGVGAGFLSCGAVRARDGADKPAYSIANCVSEFSTERVQKTDKGWTFWFVPSSLSKELTFKMTEVSAHSANHPPHAHPGEEIIFVFEGKVEFTLSGESKAVGPNSSLYCPPGIPHGIRNVGDTPIRYAIIRTTN